MGKNTVRKRKRHYHGNRYTKKRNTETQNEQEATSSSSRAKKLQDSLNYSTSIVDELDQDDYNYLFLDFKIASYRKRHFRDSFYVQNVISQQLTL